MGRRMRENGKRGAQRIDEQRKFLEGIMKRVVHFEIYTDDPEAVQPFYQDVFDWQFKKFEGGPVEYWLVTTGGDKDGGINGGLLRPREGQSPGTINTIAVASLDGTTKKIEQGGGKICVPKMAIPKMGWLAYAEDPAGNVFGLMEPDTSAR
jgi:predicted enzyme related to lactoylglutathione lyase